MRGKQTTQRHWTLLQDRPQRSSASSRSPCLGRCLPLRGNASRADAMTIRGLQTCDGSTARHASRAAARRLQVCERCRIAMYRVSRRAPRVSRLACVRSAAGDQQKCIFSSLAARTRAPGRCPSDRDVKSWLLPALRAALRRWHVQLRPARCVASRASGRAAPRRCLPKAWASSLTKR